MQRKFLFPLFTALLLAAPSPAQSSFPYLTTSNGLIVATYNTDRNVVEGVWPHIFANIDSAHFVHPFAGNIRLRTQEKPLSTEYRRHTHGIECRYRNFTVDYLAPFTTGEKVFYIVLRGKRSIVETLSTELEHGEGRAQSGVTHLTNPFEPLPEHYAGQLLMDSILLTKPNGQCEKILLFSFTDALHHDKDILKRAITRLKQQPNSIVEQETAWMRALIGRCRLPKGIKPAERAALEQSISVLTMSQVSDREIFPKGRGQVLASLRPGIWHVAWVRDGAYAIQAMTRLGMYEAARKALTFMLQADAGRFKHYRFTDGKDYGPGVDYRISLTRYFGNGTEECDYNEYGPNIEYDDWGLFLTAYSDYVLRSGDQSFARQWNAVVESQIADAIVAVTDTNGMIRADSGPWEHHLKNVKQYAFTSTVCANGLRLFADMEQKMGAPADKYRAASIRLLQGMYAHLLIDGRFFKSNAQEQDPKAPEYHDAGLLELFACGLLPDARALFRSNMAEYDPLLRIQGDTPGYIRMHSDDLYENQEWVFINLRMACAFKQYGQPEKSRQIMDRMTQYAAWNHHQFPEMLTYNNLWNRPVSDYQDNEAWCYCVRDKNNQYAGAIPMAGYGAGAYVLALFSTYGVR